MHDLNKLRIWVKSVELTKKVYRLTKTFPDDEKFGLISQIRRCSVSISSNIAEGAGRESVKEFKYFLSIANGSSFELYTQLIIALELNYIEKKDFEIIVDNIDEIQKMNFNLQRKLH
jgi:four helix bundle protein